MNIKLVVTDMDDTLLSHDLQVSRENKATVRALEDRGIQVVLASGRSLYSMAPYVRELELDRRPGFVISWNGAQVTDSFHGTLLFEYFLPVDLAHEIVDWALSRSLVIQTHHGSEIRGIGQNSYSILDSQLSGMSMLQVNKEDFFHYPHPKILIPGDPVELEEVEQEISRRWGKNIGLFRSKPYFLEIMPPEADKGLALAHLCREIGVSQSEVMAIGDGGNDVNMVRWAGLGVAMGNGTKEIQSVARWVTTRTNNEGGFAEAVNRFILTD